MSIVAQRYKKYRHHRNNAKHRGIPWEMTFIEWALIWACSGYWNERGRKSGQYVMARPGDKGPYVVGNVKIILHTENTKEASIGNQYRLGKKLSSKTRTKISRANLGRKLSSDTRARMSEGQRGRKHSTETRAKMSVVQKARWI